MTWEAQGQSGLGVLMSQEGFQLFWVCSVSLLAGVKLSVVNPDLADLAVCLELEKMKVYVAVFSSGYPKPVFVFK